MSGVFKKYNAATGQWEAILAGEQGVQGPQGATLDVVNNTNNYLLTATGGSTVNGESGLTWDGTQLEITGSIIPAADNIYDLGSQGRTWRDVYVGPGSLYVDGTKVLSSQAAELVITTDAGQSLKILETGADDITLQTETGNIELKGTVEIESGKKITDSAATQVVIGDSLKVEGNITPDLNEARDLGSSSLRWRDLYLSGNTLHLGDTKFTRTDTGDVEVKDSNGNRKKVIADAIELRRGGKVVKIDIDETSGQLITTANDSTESQVNVPSLEARDSVIQADVDSLETRLVADISTETGRIDAILTGASADTDTFVEVVSLINGVDTANDQAFASYVLRTDASVDSLEGQVTQVGTSGNETTGTVTLAGSGATTVSQTGNTVTINTPTVAGPQGPQGVNGTIGVDGAQGPTGPQGNNGSNGSTGAQGPTGPTGGTGSTGAQGVQGPAGTSGSGTANYLTKWNGTTSQTNSLIYDNGTNVGIGTTGPRQKLNVNGHIETMSGYGLKASYNNTDAYHGSLSWATLQLGNNGDNRIIGGRTATGGNLKFYVNNTNDATQYSTTPDGTLAMTIASDGNVGIGTTTPTEKLDVDGTARTTQGTYLGTASGNVIVGGTTSDVTGQFKFISIGNSAFQFGPSTGTYLRIEPGIADAEVSIKADARSGAYPPLAFFTSDSERLRILANGNVGIGTIIPQNKLTVKAATNYNINLGELGSYGALYVYNDAASAYKELRIDASSLLLNTYSGGNVGIGTSSPSSKLHVKTGSTGGILILEGSAGRYITTGVDGGGQYIEQVGTSASERTLRIQSSNGSGAYTQLFLDGHNQRIFTSSNVNVGIGTDSPTAPLTVQSSGVMGRFQTGANSDGRVEFAYNTTDIAYINVQSTSLFDITARSGVALALGSGGSERMRIDAAGNVGIGTTSPGAKLEVSGGSGAINGSGLAYLNNFDDAFSLVLDNAGTSSQNDRGVFEARVGGSSVFRINNSGNVGIGTTNPLNLLSVHGSEPVLRIQDTDDSGVMFIGNASGYSYIRPFNRDFRFIDAAGNSLMAIKSGGNVGIGTTSPSASAKLHVNGTTRTTSADIGTTSGDIYISNLNRLGFTGAPIIEGQSSTKPLLIGTADAQSLILYTNASERMRITSSGNVGIGTTSPTNSLHVAGSGTVAFFEGAGGAGFVGIRDSDDGTIGYIGVDGGKLLFQTSGSSYSTKLAIDAVGNVGIGTTSPSATLHLSSAAPYIYLDDISTSGTRNRFEILNGDVGTTQTATFSFNNTSGTNLQQVISFNENGNVGIGTTSPTSKLQVNGTILPGENGTQNLGSNTLRWNTVYTSDLSLKNDVGDWTIVEGEDDLFLYNNKRDKVYKFNLTEVDKETAPKKRS